MYFRQGDIVSFLEKTEVGWGCPMHTKIGNRKRIGCHLCVVFPSWSRSRSTRRFYPDSLPNGYKSDSWARLSSYPDGSTLSYNRYPIPWKYGTLDFHQFWTQDQNSRMHLSPSQMVTAGTILNQIRGRLVCNQDTSYHRDLLSLIAFDLLCLNLPSISIYGIGTAFINVDIFDKNVLHIWFIEVKI